MYEEVKKLDTSYFINFIAQKIVNGEYKVDGFLPEDEIIAKDANLGLEQVKIGRHSLEALGILVRVEGHKFIIKNEIQKSFNNLFTLSFALQNTQYSEALDLRAIYEEAALKIAIETMDDTQISFLEQILLQLNSEQETEVYDKFDHLFHDTIIKASNNNFLIAMYNSTCVYLDTVIKDIRGIIIHDATIGEELNRDHYEIFRCIKNRDVKGGIIALKAHFNEVKKFINTLNFDAFERRTSLALTTGGFAKIFAEKKPLFLSVSKNLATLLGYKDEAQFLEITKGDPKNIMSTEDYKMLVYLANNLNYDNPETRTYNKAQKMKRIDGSYVDVINYGNMTLDENGNKIFFSYFSKLDTKANNTHSNYEVLIENLNEIFFEIKIDSKKFDIINKMSNQFDWGNLDYLIQNGLTEDAIIRISDIWDVHSYDLSTFKKTFKRCAFENKKETMTVRLKNDFGNYCWCKIVLIPLFEEGKLKSIVGKINNVDVEKTKEENLIQQSKVDSFTNLLNKSSFTDQVKSILKKGSDKESALIFIDLDSFKSINDNMGHIFGDKVLLDAVKIINKNFRSNDLIARFGGDEFYIFINEITYDALKEKLNGLIKALNIEYKQDNITIKSSASIGAAYCLNDKVNYLTFLNLADDAMYDSKKNGKNQYTIKIFSDN